MTRTRYHATICDEMAKRIIYNAGEAAKRLGVDRATLYRWIQWRWIKDVCRDYAGDRVFTDADIKRIQAWKNRLVVPGQQKGGRKR